MLATLEHPVYVTRADGSRAPSPEYIADLLGLERKLEAALQSGHIESPPSLFARFFAGSTEYTIKPLTQKDRARFTAMLADVKKALSGSVA
jgi:hypothetical protein